MCVALSETFTETFAVYVAPRNLHIALQYLFASFPRIKDAKVQPIHAASEEITRPVLM